MTSCKTCKHYVGVECRRFPPTIPPRGQESGHQYPKPDPAKPCGEYVEPPVFVVAPNSGVPRTKKAGK